jgi:hypothetical protein
LINLLISVEYFKTKTKNDLFDEVSTKKAKLSIKSNGSKRTKVT